MRLIQSGQYENAVIAGADVITKFVLSGFQSFQAVSPGLCKPFDINRDGIASLGEGAATIILSSNPQKGHRILKLWRGGVVMMPTIFRRHREQGRSLVMQLTKRWKKHIFCLPESILYPHMVRLPFIMMKWKQKPLHLARSARHVPGK